MTTPVAPPAPAPRQSAATAADGGSASGGPFAAALDTALADDRAAVGEGSGDTGSGGAPGDEPGDAPAGEVPAGPVVPAAAAWVLGLGPAAATAGTGGDGPGATGAAGAGSVPGVPPGLAVALEHARGVAGGLRGRAAEVDVPAAGEPTPATGASGPPGPPGGLPPTAAARAHAQLQAALAAVPGAGAGGPTTVLVEAVVDGVGPGATLASPPPGVPAGTGPGTAGTPAAPAGASAAAAPLPGQAGSGSSAGGGGAGTPSGEHGTPTVDAVPELGPAGQGATPTAPVAGTAGAEPAQRAAADQPVSAQVARQVAVLRSAADGSHTMTLVLTPETLGPVEVSVTVSAGTLELTLRAAGEHGRAALLDALPDLRRDLEQAGLSVARADVDRETGSRSSEQSRQHTQEQQGQGQHAPGDRGQGRGDSRYRGWPGPADSTGGPIPAAQRTTSSGVDVRV